MRKISNRFSVDGDEIIKTSNGEAIPHDEPLLILRARDRLALPILRMYRELSIVDGCNDWFLGELLKTIADFEDFAAKYPERMKQPGVTRGK
jgi:hypothetical protein